SSSSPPPTISATAASSNPGESSSPTSPTSTSRTSPTPATPTSKRATSTSPLSCKPPKPTATPAPYPSSIHGKTSPGTASKADTNSSAKRSASRLLPPRSVPLSESIRIHPRLSVAIDDGSSCSARHQRSSSPPAQGSPSP